MGGLLASFSQDVLLVVEYPGMPAVTPGLPMQQRHLSGIQHHSRYSWEQSDVYIRVQIELIPP